MNNYVQSSGAAETTPISFLWLELTNRCNLQCSHCYAESSPHSGSADALAPADYQRLIVDAYQLGCRRIQFIGGEPTLNSSLPALIRLANDVGYVFIEVFTNLTRLSDELLSCFQKYGVQVATSVYASTPRIHDEITHLDGSFSRTTTNIRRLLEAGVSVRAGVISMQQNAGQTDNTIDYLRKLGVQNVGTDRLRQFGRGNTTGKTGLADLCGGCAENTLCVNADGTVSPCIMSKLWSVGSALDTPLNELSNSERLAQIRSDIYRAVVEPRKNGGEQPQVHAICTPKTCGPYSTCAPKLGPGPCAPSGCNPCYPKG